jgi:hypothetical protein
VPTIERIPWWALGFVEWPWPGHADAADIASYEAAEKAHDRHCMHCLSWQQHYRRRLQRGSFVGGCRWGYYLQDMRRRLATRGEGDSFYYPATVGKPAAS